VEEEIGEELLSFMRLKIGDRLPISPHTEPSEKTNA
jgi:hypothetical protein